ncbi:hypothetical protein DFH06DRAFT_329005 [Mycena polygramma]|nr:hypothetical protein DFH06DRAFT_329005 [Mycena polygramma]
MHPSPNSDFLPSVHATAASFPRPPRRRNHCFSGGTFQPIPTFFSRRSASPLEVHVTAASFPRPPRRRNHCFFGCIYHSFSTLFLLSRRSASPLEVPAAAASFPRPPRRRNHCFLWGHLLANSDFFALSLDVRYLLSKATLSPLASHTLLNVETIVSVGAPFTQFRLFYT